MLLKPSAILLCFLLSLQFSTAQKNEIALTSGMQFLPDHFLFSWEFQSEHWGRWVESSMGYGADLSFRHYMSSEIALTAGVDYLYTYVNYEGSEYRDHLGQETDIRPLHSYGHYVFPELGIAYHLGKDKRWSFYSELSLQVGLHLGHVNHLEHVPRRRIDLAPYEKDYPDGILYGPGFTAGSIFTPWKTGSGKQFSLQFMVNSQFLRYWQSNYNWKFSFGPRVGIGYQF